MFKSTVYKGTVLPLNVSNVDTDAIIPKQFLQKVNKTGFGKYLFHDWRYFDKNQFHSNPDFVLNKEVYKDASILLSQDNFKWGFIKRTCCLGFIRLWF